MMRRFAAIALGVALSCLTASLTVPGVSQGATPSCTTTPAPAPVNATIPPELQLLAEKTKHLRFATIRLSAQTVLAAEGGKLILDVHTQLRRSPRESLTTATSRELSPSGKSSSENQRVLEIDGMSYRYEPALTHEDGGRPWVRERSHPKNSKATSLAPSLAQLAEAESIVAMGTESLNGQQVSRFTVTFAPGVYPQSTLPLGELLEKDCPQPVLVELAIAPSGVPIDVKVSTGYIKSGKVITTSSTTRILATNFHFSPLKPPPPKRTIGQAALGRLRKAKLATFG
jgi:hypothetical protein